VSWEPVFGLRGNVSFVILAVCVNLEPVSQTAHYGSWLWRIWEIFIGKIQKLTPIYAGWSEGQVDDLMGNAFNSLLFALMGLKYLKLSQRLRKEIKIPSFINKKLLINKTAKLDLCCKRSKKQEYKQTFFFPQCHWARLPWSQEMLIEFCPVWTDAEDQEQNPLNFTAVFIQGFFCLFVCWFVGF